MDINLKDVQTDLITFVQGISAFTSKPDHVREYEGEYEDNDWTEKHPSCLIEITSVSPSSRDATRDATNMRVEFIMLVGAKVSDAKHPLEITSEIINSLEGTEFDYDDSTLTAHLRSINLYGRNKRLKIYALRWELAG